MKYLVSKYLVTGFTLALTAFLGLGALASTANAVEVRYEWPAVNGIMINNACATDETFKTLKPVRVCTQTAAVSRTACRYHGEAEIYRSLMNSETPKFDEVVHEDVRCVARELRDLEVSRYVTSHQCVEFAPISEASSGECLRFEEQTEKAGRVYYVSKYELRGGEVGDVYAGSERFEIPRCH